MDSREYIDKVINDAIEYAKDSLEFDPRNENYVKNTLLDILDGVECDGVTPELRDAIYGAISLSPSEINAKFGALVKEDSRKATDWLYDYCAKNEYVKLAAINGNPRFELDGLVITINKVKPEYGDPKKAARGNSVEGGYAKCSICRENEGFFGRSKRTLRTVDLKLGGEDWFWQYSPYGYFKEHGIAVNCTHTPMHVDRGTFTRLMDFVDMFPHYFIGCNAALPRIGGSVLAHDHYQGGGEILPMHKAGAAYTLRHRDFPDAIVEVLDWNGTVVRVVSRSRADIENICELIRKKWVDYNDDKLGIISDTADGKHNAISPSVVKTARGYEMNVILRSNLTSKDFPDGVFNTRPAYHIVKKESVGLIEAQGLFILPGRLDAELKTVEELVESGKPLPEEMKDFAVVYDGVKSIYGKNKAAGVHKAMQKRLADICHDILSDTAVFKDKNRTVEFLRDLGIA